MRGGDGKTPHPILSNPRLMNESAVSINVFAEIPVQPNLFHFRCEVCARCVRAKKEKMQAENGFQLRSGTVLLNNGSNRK